MTDTQPEQSRGLNLRFIFKSNVEGLGTIVLAGLYYRRHKLWLEAVFLPLNLEETLKEFREAFSIVFPEYKPITFPNVAHRPIGAR